MEINKNWVKEMGNIVKNYGDKIRALNIWKDNEMQKANESFKGAMYLDTVKKIKDEYDEKRLEYNKILDSLEPIMKKSEKEFHDFCIIPIPDDIKSVIEDYLLIYGNIPVNEIKLSEKEENSLQRLCKSNVSARKVLIKRLNVSIGTERVELIIKKMEDKLESVRLIYLDNMNVWRNDIDGYFYRLATSSNKIEEIQNGINSFYSEFDA